MLSFDTKDQVRTLVLQRPQRRNALIPELSSALLASLNSAMVDSSIRAIVLAAAGPAFCAGLDLDFARTATKAELSELVDQQQAIARTILFGRKPVIAAVHGHAVGGGFEMALACDVVVWGDTADGWFPEVAKGLVATGGVSALLPLSVGLARAKSMLFFGERWSGAALQTSGLVHRVVPSAEVAACAFDLARRLAEQPSDALAFAKRALLAGAAGAIRAALDLETQGAVAGPASAHDNGDAGR